MNSEFYNRGYLDGLRESTRGKSLSLTENYFYDSYTPNAMYFSGEANCRLVYNYRSINLKAPTGPSDPLDELPYLASDLDDLIRFVESIDGKPMSALPGRPQTGTYAETRYRVNVLRVGLYRPGGMDRDFDWFSYEDLMKRNVSPSNARMHYETSDYYLRKPWMRPEK